MDVIILNKLVLLKQRFYELKQLIRRSDIIKNHKYFRSLCVEYNQLSEVVTQFEKWLDLKEKINSTKNTLSNIDQDDLKELSINKNHLEKELKMLCLPKDPYDKYNCFIELRAGTGGKEAAIFAGELFKMYVRYSEIKKWSTEIIHSTYGECGGYKEIVAKITCVSKREEDKSYKQLKFESGGHRVQRVPNTESQGRIHTSTCTIAVIPEIPNIMLPDINFNDLRIDTFRSSGAGGQHVNKTDSAIRITHVPTGLSVECQNERSQHKNKAKALSVLRARLYSINIQKRQKEESNIRRNLIGTGDRSDRIRTYNFQQGRVTDHRVNFTSYKLNEIMNGKLDILIQPVMNNYYSKLLNQLSN